MILTVLLVSLSIFVGAIISFYTQEEKRYILPWLFQLITLGAISASIITFQQNINAVVIALAIIGILYFFIQKSALFFWMLPIFIINEHGAILSWCIGMLYGSEVIYTKKNAIQQLFKDFAIFIIISIIIFLYNGGVV